MSIYAKDARAALMTVELGEAALGIVYKSDAIKSSKVKIVGTFDSVSHSKINYVAAICNSSHAILNFYLFMDSDAAKPIWKKHGFVI